MTPRIAKGRTQPCTVNHAKTRLDHANKFLEVAELVADEGNDIEYTSVSASLVVLSGIAAADAACCKKLGKRSRGQDHHQAEDLIRQIKPDGDKAANALHRLLDLKDQAHYGLFDV